MNFKLKKLNKEFITEFSGNSTNEYFLVLPSENALPLYDQLKEFITEAKENNFINNEQNKTEEQLWLENLDKIINKKMGNYNLTSVEIADEMLMSRSNFFRKIKKATGITPLKYLRAMRFKRAHQLLIQPNCNSVKEVAHKIGLKDVKHFSRLFISYYSKKPSTVLNSK